MAVLWRLLSAKRQTPRPARGLPGPVRRCRRTGRDSGRRAGRRQPVEQGFPHPVRCGKAGGGLESVSAPASGRRCAQLALPPAVWAPLPCSSIGVRIRVFPRSNDEIIRSQQVSEGDGRHPEPESAGSPQHLPPPRPSPQADVAPIEEIPPVFRPPQQGLSRTGNQLASGLGACSWARNRRGASRRAGSPAAAGGGCRCHPILSNGDGPGGSQGPG